MGMISPYSCAFYLHEMARGLSFQEPYLTTFLLQASPKFSTFICLTCAGTHRGLGVHISFVRSISMDAFKQNEISRMQNGGNKAWQDFYNQNSGTSFEESTIRERYDSEVGEEWKERITAKVDGTEFDKAVWSKERAAILQKQASRSATPVGPGSKKPMVGIGGDPASRSESPAGGRAGLPPVQKAKNEAYFAKMGEANSSRPDDLPPNQGGKFAGFGSAPAQPERPQGGMPSADEFQKDPVAALTKGFGWFSSVVGKQAKVVNDSYIQPTAKTVRRDGLRLYYILMKHTDLYYRSYHQNLQHKRAQWPLKPAKPSSPAPKAQLNLSTNSLKARTRKQVVRRAEVMSLLRDRTSGTALALLKLQPNMEIRARWARVR
jgi:hypothetical protein